MVVRGGGMGDFGIFDLISVYVESVSFWCHFFTLAWYTKTPINVARKKTQVAYICGGVCW